MLGLDPWTTTMVTKRAIQPQTKGDILIEAGDKQYVSRGIVAAGLWRLSDHDVGSEQYQQ